MGAGTIVVFILIMLGLAIYSVRQVIADEPRKRMARVLLLVIAATFGVSVVGIIYAIALADTYTDVSFAQLVPLGIITGVALVELGPALKKAALKVLGRQSETIATLTVTREGEGPKDEPHDP